MRYLILGATGTLGRAMIDRLLQSESTTLIRCLSRDELKLSELSQKFPDNRIETVIGDIRDKSSIWSHFQDIDVVFHFAALKRIPEMESQPMESVKTNILGTINAAECALAYNVRHFMFSSTDKACRPVNTYGACKFLSEKLLLKLNKQNKTNFSVYRWGNIISSRGSIIPTFVEKLKNENTIGLTDEKMSRFWIKIEDAVTFVLSTYQEKKNAVRIPPMKAAPVKDVVKALARLLGKTVLFEVIGLRPGEKLHEDILFIDDWCEAQTSRTAAQYTGNELEDLFRGAV